MSEPDKNFVHLESIRTRIKAFRRRHGRYARMPDQIRKEIGDTVRSGVSKREVARFCDLNFSSVDSWTKETAPKQTNAVAPEAPRILEIVESQVVAPQVRISCESSRCVIELTLAAG